MPVTGATTNCPTSTPPNGSSRAHRSATPRSALFDGFANGILVTTRNGRPLKIEGNPDHPWSRGGTDVLAQASVLGLYDPFRSQAVQHIGRPSSWAAFQGAILAQAPAWQATGGAGIALLTGPSTSPALEGRDRADAGRPIRRMRWYVGAGVARDGIYQGARQAFGRPVETLPDFAKARTIVALDGDILDLGPGQVGLSRRWSEARKASHAAGNLLTLHAAAPTPSLTSAKADFALPVAASRLEALARDLLSLAEGGSAASGEGAAGAWLTRASAALNQARGAGIVTAGLTGSPDLHALVHRLNGVLGNAGATVRYTTPAQVAGGGSLRDLTTAMADGSVDTLIVLGANPVYDAPGALDFAQAMERVRLKIHAGLYYDETAAHSDWHLPQAHPLESWGDARALDGTVSLIQPTIAPLYNGRSAHEILAFLGRGTVEGGLDLLKQHLRAEGETDRVFEGRFEEALRQGFLPDSAAKPEPVTLTQAGTPAPAAAVGSDAIEVVFRPDPTVWDGALADLGWLQELPKPLTKIVWENVVGISPKRAERDGLANGDIVRVAAEGRAVEGPVWITPGQDENTVDLGLGYGRDVPDHLSSGLGYAAGALRPAESPGRWRARR